VPETLRSIFESSRDNEERRTEKGQKEKYEKPDPIIELRLSL
jgi:hypothetical protein